MLNIKVLEYIGISRTTKNLRILLLRVTSVIANKISITVNLKVVEGVTMMCMARGFLVQDVSESS